MNEIAVTVTGISSSSVSYFYPSEIIQKYSGFGSKARTLSGKPLEIVRAKRLDSITLKFQDLDISEYEYFRTIWTSGYACTLSSYMPSVYATGCFIELDGFNLVTSRNEKYSGEIVFLVG